MGAGLAGNASVGVGLRPACGVFPLSQVSRQHVTGRVILSGAVNDEYLAWPAQSRWASFAADNSPRTPAHAIVATMPMPQRRRPGNVWRQLERRALEAIQSARPERSELC